MMSFIKLILKEVFEMSMAEKIKILLVKSGGIPEAELARRLGVTPQTFNKKMKRDNFSENDLKEIAGVLNCEYEINFIIPDTGEKI